MAVNRGCSVGGFPILWHMVIYNMLRELNGKGYNAVCFADDL